MANMQTNVAAQNPAPHPNLTLQNHKLYYLLPSGHFSGLTKSLKIYSIPSSNFEKGSILTKSVFEKAKKLTATATAQPIFTLKRENLTGSRMVYSDESSEISAEWNVPLLSFGTSELIFPYESQYSSHAITIEPLGTVKRGVKFIKDSVPYEWNVESKDDPAVYVLFKIIGTEKTVVGEFMGEGHQAGLVVVDEGEVDPFVAVAGVVAILQRSDSFVK
jgi:hypothetical protein